MKYLKTYEKIEYEFEIGEYVKMYSDYYTTSFLRVNNINYYNDEFYLIDAINNKQLGWVNKKYIRHLTHEEIEEVEMKIRAQKYNL